MVDCGVRGTGGLGLVERRAQRSDKMKAGGSGSALELGSSFFLERAKGKGRRLQVQGVGPD